MTILRTIGFSLALLLAVSPSAAETRVNKQVTYYPIEGDTSREIRRSLDTRSPVSIDGRTFDAYTRWHISWKYSSIEETGFCSITEISTTLFIDQTLPRIRRVPAAVRRSWQRYYAALISHEDHHADFGRRAAAEIEQALHALPAMESCRELGRAVHATARRIIDRYVTLEKRYDRRTDYGAEEGAHFP